MQRLLVGVALSALYSLLNQWFPLSTVISDQFNVCVWAECVCVVSLTVCSVWVVCVVCVVSLTVCSVWTECIILANTITLCSYCQPAILQVMENIPDFVIII